MTIFSDRELRQHERWAGGWLPVALLLGWLGAWMRARDVWAPEYRHALLGVAAVMLFASLAWRLMIFGQVLWQRATSREAYARLRVYLIFYSLNIIAAVAWMVYEQRRLPEIAWMRASSVSATILYGLLVLLAPWALTFAAHSVLGKARAEPS